MIGQFTFLEEIGVYVEKHGRRLRWDELKVGDVVVFDVSTKSTPWFRTMEVENFSVTPDGYERVILNNGSKQRTLVDRWRYEKGEINMYAEV